MLDQHISKKHEILDLGAGTGIYSFYYAEKGNTVVSTDITPKHVQMIKTKADESWVSKILDEGRIFSHDAPGFWTDAYFHSPSEIDKLLTKQNIRKIANIATDGIGLYLRDTVNTLSEAEFEQWVAYHLRTCSEPSILGMSNHGLFVGQKVD
ncbi:methyltransferase domain-containing protein [Paenibacillus sanfengchensis]|uniref:methyltransferase domain-containing protein n=1 Tax=Paenibacillus sanfengchensis TaxID=3119819 RepID=UPI003A5C081C